MQIPLASSLPRAAKKRTVTLAKLFSNRQTILRGTRHRVSLFYGGHWPEEPAWCEGRLLIGLIDCLPCPFTFYQYLAFSVRSILAVRSADFHDVRSYRTIALADLFHRRKQALRRRAYILCKRLRARLRDRLGGGRGDSRGRCRNPGLWTLDPAEVGVQPER